MPYGAAVEDPAIQAMQAKIYSDQDAWPLKTREEAMLFRHYVQKLSIWVRLENPPFLVAR